MRAMTRLQRGTAAGLVAALIAGMTALAQDTTPTQTGAQVAPKPPRLDEAVAIVNDEKVTKAELVNLLGQFQIPPGSEERAYETAVDRLVNTLVLEQFLRKAKVQVPSAEIEQNVDEYKKQLEQQNTTLTKALADTNTTLDEFRGTIERSLQWKTYVMTLATDAELKKYFQKNADVFSGTTVRASHILLRVDPEATPEQKEQTKKKLEGIQQEILDKKISFADAANKYSEDEGNVAQNTGGDLGYFPRRGVFIEPFAAAAFALKKDVVSGPIETEYGLHLVLVTDRKEGQLAEFDRIRNEVLNQYATDLQNDIVEAERKKAAIDIKPMPSDLIQIIKPETSVQPAGSTAPSPAAAPPAKTEGEAAK
jgi:parvulin-like peptidyl-prolyl isomerase